MKREPILHTANGKTLNVTWINSTTKQAEQKISAYENAKVEDVRQAYKRPSGNKIYVFDRIKQEMSDVGGFGMRITGAGCDVFSCAYQVKDGAGFTFIIYHTPCNRFAIEYRRPW